jgi:hypothetical protein
MTPQRGMLHKFVVDNQFSDILSQRLYVTTRTLAVRDT